MPANLEDCSSEVLKIKKSSQIELGSESNLLPLSSERRMFLRGFTLFFPRMTWLLIDFLVFASVVREFCETMKSRSDTESLL